METTNRNILDSVFYIYTTLKELILLRPYYRRFNSLYILMALPIPQPYTQRDYHTLLAFLYKLNIEKLFSGSVISSDNLAYMIQGCYYCSSPSNQAHSKNCKVKKLHDYIKYKLDDLWIENDLTNS